MYRVQGAAGALVVAIFCFTVFQVHSQDVDCRSRSAFRDYLKTRPNLKIFSSLANVFEASGIDPDPRTGFTVFAPTTNAWGAFVAGLDGFSAKSGVTEEQLQLTLSVGLYHYSRMKLPSPAKALAAVKAQSALGDLLGLNVSLYFTQALDDQIRVEGIPLGNRAPLSEPKKVCTDVSLYEIDTVLLPTGNLSNVPAFDDIVAAFAAALRANSRVGDEGAFKLRTSSFGEAVNAAATGEGIVPDSKSWASINRETSRFSNSGAIDPFAKLPSSTPPTPSKSSYKWIEGAAR